MVLPEGAHPRRHHQAVTAPDGLPLWVSEAEPGSVHDITAARLHALPALYRAAAADLPTLADSGYEGAGLGILIPVKRPPGGGELDIDTRTRDAILRSLRCLGERGFALLPACLAAARLWPGGTCSAAAVPAVLRRCLPCVGSSTVLRLVHRASARPPCFGRAYRPAYGAMPLS